MELNILNEEDNEIHFFFIHRCLFETGKRCVKCQWSYRGDLLRFKYIFE